MVGTTEVPHPLGPVRRPVVPAHGAKSARSFSATPGQFKEFVEDVALMQRTQSNYCTQDFAKTSAHVRIAQSERDESIKSEHAKYLARTIPGASFILLDKPSSADLDHNGTHAFAAGILPMCLLDLIKPEGIFDWHGYPSVFEPFKKLYQI